MLNTAGGSQADPEVMKRIITPSMAAVEDPTWGNRPGPHQVADGRQVKDYDDVVASRQRIYRQPGFVAAMRDIMALQDPEIRARNLMSPNDYGSITAPTLVLWTSDDPTADVSEGQRIATMIPGARFEVMAGCRHWPQYGPQDVQPAASGLPAGPLMTIDADVLVVGAEPVGLTLANVLGLQGVNTVVVDERDSLIDPPARRRPDDRALRAFQSIRAGRRRLPHTVPNQILRASTPTADCSSKWPRPTRGSAGPTQRLSSSPWSTPNCLRALTVSSTSAFAGAPR